MDPNWVPKPNKINKHSNEICRKVQRIVSNTNAYNRISVVWGGGDDTPHGVFDTYTSSISCVYVPFNLMPTGRLVTYSVSECHFGSQGAPCGRIVVEV